MESAFRPSEAMFHSPIYNHQGPFPELFLDLSILSVSLLLQKCQMSGNSLKFDNMNDFISIIFSVIPINKDSLFRAFIWFAAFLHNLFI